MSSDHPSDSKSGGELNRRELLRWGALSGITAAPVLAGANTGTAPESASGGNGDKSQVRSYKPLGRTGLEIADISFGASRLRRGEENLVRKALDQGINYFDTAESYTGGASETVIGNALKGRRDDVILASKMFAGANTSQSDMMHNLEESLRKLKTDRIEVYFNHAVNHVDRLQNDNWYEFIEKAKQQGKVRFSGISGHAGRLIECLDHAIDNALIDVMLVAYNFGQDPEFYSSFTRGFDMIAKQPELPRVIEKAHKKGVGVIAMKTLMGARLNDMRPYEANGQTFAQAAFSWVLSNTNVDALIISMTSEQKIDEFLGASGNSSVAAAQLKLLQHYAKLNHSSYCRHACDSCESSCPMSVPIPDVLRTRMYALDYEDYGFARDEYAMLENNAEACLSCSGQPCMNACPHGIKVSDLCGPTHELLS